MRKLSWSLPLTGQRLVMLRRPLLRAACRPVTIFTFLGATLPGSMAGPAAAQQLGSAPAPRPYRVDDRFATEELGSVTLAPDGRAVAFTRIRSARSQLTNALLIKETRSDIWLQEAPGQPARNLTQGHADSSGWWTPQWSPDGARLAFLSSRGGTVTLWGWERATNQVRQLSREGVDFEEGRGCRWVDARRLLCLVMPKGERSLPLDPASGQGIALTEAAWGRAKRGERTASAISSLAFPLPTRRLWVVDVTTGTGRSLATTQVDGYGSASSWLAPGGRAIAVVAPRPAEFPLFYRMAIGYPGSIELRSLEGQPIRLDRPLPENVVTTTVQWSPDGTMLAFFALEDRRIHPELLYGEGWREVRYPTVDSKEYPGRPYRVDLRRGRVESWNTGDLDLGQESLPPSFQWTAAGQLLFRAPVLKGGGRPLSPAPATWLVLGRDGRTQALTQGAPTKLPDTLMPIESGAAFVGLADGDLWRVVPASGQWVNLTTKLQEPVVRFSTHEGAREGAHFLLVAGAPKSDTERSYVRFGLSLPGFGQDYLLAPGSREPMPLRRPAPTAELVAYAPQGRTRLYFADEFEQGAFLWRQTGTAKPEPLASANMFRQRIVQPERRIIEYHSANGGEVLKAKLTLPIGYRAGRRVPLVVDSDIGYTPAATFGGLYDLAPSIMDTYTGDFFAAAGYAYLFTSMPTRTGMDEVGRANLLLFTQGVLSAVDKVIEMGIADPDRLFLHGESSMGYGVYGLVTQTSRFKAAVADVGWVDQITFSLGISPTMRYSENPFDHATMRARYSAFRLPFWRNADHLRRNSPLSYVDRVQTPLMLVGGDMDFAGRGLVEPEMFFSALVQQRKPAQLVRYWGEWHGKDTPANARDLYQRVFAWYDRWGDIVRDATGDIVYDGSRAKFRGDASVLQPEDYARFPVFGPGGDPPATNDARASATPLRRVDQRSLAQ